MDDTNSVLLSLFLQVYLCFQRVAAEILGVKLNKAEIEQSQVSHNYVKGFKFALRLSLFVKGESRYIFLFSFMINVIPDHSEDVRSIRPPRTLKTLFL